ncbi:MAG: hypothetical protein DRR00_29600 [Candidatus Parabeggiatoa sp. nov. 3]|nr:MAG: hypothetical protein DRR00_29600 [Gammaproteobacteria bacterium]
MGLSFHFGWHQNLRHHQYRHSNLGRINRCRWLWATHINRDSFRRYWFDFTGRDTRRRVSVISPRVI